MDFGVDRKRRLDLCTNQRGALDLGKLVNLTADSRDALECHIARCTGCADVRLLVVDRKNAVLDRSTNEAVCLAVPSSQSAACAF